MKIFPLLLLIFLKWLSVSNATAQVSESMKDALTDYDRRYNAETPKKSGATTGLHIGHTPLIPNNTDIMMYEALKKCLYIMRQDYMIQKNATVAATKENQAYFEGDYSLAVAAGEKVWVLSSMHHPWYKMFDEESLSDLKATKHLTNQVFRRLSDSKMRIGQLNIDSTQTSKASAYSSTMIEEYIPIADLPLDDALFLIIAYTESAVDPTDGNINLKVYDIKKQWIIDGKLSNQRLSKDTKDKYNFLGGAFFSVSSLDNSNLEEGSQTSTTVKKGNKGNKTLGALQIKFVGIMDATEEGQILIKMVSGSK